MPKNQNYFLFKGEKYTVVYIPDFEINTQGKDTVDAMKMARDAIGIIGIDMEDEGESLPERLTIISLFPSFS